MDEVAARSALEAVGLIPTRIEPILGGWASWTFELDGELIVRFPRNDDTREAMHREMRLLPELAAHVSFRVPVPLHTTDDWFVYEKIPGREFEVGDDLDGALAMIGELHTFPVARAQVLLQRPSWGWYLHDQWPILEEAVLPTLDGGGQPVGIIDFEDAIVGDPEIDLVPLHAELGLPLTERMWFYRWVGSLHAIHYYVLENQPMEVAGAAAELRRRLDSRPEQ